MANERASPGPPAANVPRFALRLGLSLPLVLQLVGVFVPGPLLWGTGHLAYLPLPPLATALWPVSLLGLVWSPAGARLGPWLTRRVEPVLLGRREVAYVIAPLVGAGLGWLVRDRTHLLGDGILVTTLLAKGEPLHGFDALGYHVQARLATLLGATTFAAARDLAAATSTVTGALYLVAAAWSARRLARAPGEALLLYALVVWAAPLQLFLGYVECYAQLVVCLLLFAVALLRYQRGEGGLGTPAVWFAAALLWHATALLVAPLLAVAVLWPPAGSRAGFWRRAGLAAGPVVAAAGLAGLLVLVSGQDRAAFADVFAPRQGRHLLNGWEGPRGLGDWRHWKDLFNLVLLGAPAALALLVVGGPWRRNADERFPAASRLAAGSAWLLAPAVFLNLKLGMVRDWDLLAGPAVIVAVAAFAVWTARAPTPRPAAPVVGLVALVAVGTAAPWFAVNGLTAAALRRLPAVTADLPGYPRAMALVDLGRWYREAGDLDGARDAYRAAAAANPGQASVQLLYGQVLYHRGERAAAIGPLERASALDPQNGLALKMLVLANAALDRPEAALAAARQLAGRPEEDAVAAGLHGVLAEDAGLPEEAVEAYERAVRLDATRVDMMRRIGFLELLAGRGTRAEYAFRQALERDPADQEARFGLASALRLLTQRSATEPGADAARHQARLRELLGLLDDLIARGAEPERLREWRADTAAQLGR